MKDWKYNYKYWTFIDEELELEKFTTLLNEYKEYLEEIEKGSEGKKYPSGYERRFDDLWLDVKLKIKLLIKDAKRKRVSKDNLRNSLDEMMMTYYPCFCLADWDATLKYLINHYSKPQFRAFRIMKKFYIYEEELEFISQDWNVKGYDSIEIEKLLFCMLVLSKSNSSEGYYDYEAKTAFDLARFKFLRRQENKHSNPNRKYETKGTQMNLMIYDLSHYEDEKIMHYNHYTNTIRLKYSMKEGTEVEGMEFEYDCDIENIIVKYLDWRAKNKKTDKKYGYCKCCGKEIKKKSNRQKYCDKCKVIKEREKSQRYRDNMANKK